MLSAANGETVKLYYNGWSLGRRRMVDLIEWKNLERDFRKLISFILLAFLIIYGFNGFFGFYGKFVISHGKIK